MATPASLLVECAPLHASGTGARIQFESGDTVEVLHDSESQEWLCQASEERSGKGFKVVTSDGAVLCSSGPECSLRQRPHHHKETATMWGADPVEALADDDKEAAAAGVAEDDEGVMSKLSWVDKLLTLWILLAMIIGVLLGNFTDISEKLDTVQIDTVSLPIALGLWLMMWPVLCKVKYELLGDMFRHKEMWGQLTMSFVLNWLIGPLLMTGLAWATLPEDDMAGYRNGVIMVGLARCIAMVLLWNQLARGNAEYCAIMVALNSVFQIILYAPLALFYISVVSGQDMAGIDFWDVARSVLIFLGAPLVAGIITRYTVIWLAGREWFENKFMKWVGPIALIALIYTVLVLYALQGKRVIDEIGTVFRLAVPLLIYFGLMWTGAMGVSYWLGWSYDLAVTQAFTAASNNFELAIAIAVGTFGVNSEEALAATVGPLVEVPVLLALVYVALWLRHRVTWKGGLVSKLEAPARAPPAAPQAAAAAKAVVVKA